jgi:hypothetical protein
MKNLFLVWRLSVCMCASLAPEWFGELYSHLVFKILSISGQKVMNLNIPTQNIGAIQMAPKHKMVIW